MEAILEAAVQVLVSNGYGHSTTDRIAQRAGVSVGTLYQYFGGKDDVYDAVLARDASQLICALGEMTFSSSQPLEASLLAIFTDVLSTLPHFPVLLRELQSAPNALLRNRIAGLEKELRSFVRDLLETYRPQLRVDDLDVATFMIVRTSEAVATNAAVDIPAARLAIELSELLSRYLVRDQSSR